MGSKTNEEKAREILSCHKCPFRTDRPRKIDIGEDACAVCFDHKSVMEMAEWKDEVLKVEKQALIDKACEWLRNNIESDEYLSPNEESYRMGCGVDYLETNMFIEDFKNYMKGGKE